MIISAKDKAGELFYSFYRIERRGNTVDAKIIAKQCALVAVEEIIKAIPIYNYDYWQEVKKEINNI